MSELRAAYASNVVSVDAFHALLARDESEEHFQAWLVDLAKHVGLRVYHTRQVATCPRGHGPVRCHCGARAIAQGSDAGWPDLVLGRADPPLLVIPELKSERGRATPDQLVWLAILRANGVAAPLWRPSDRDEIRRVLGVAG